ncbi:hypothetical protein [Streptomyces halobius]|uniref:Lipoprotein n=1 Tax=Streptomyces halobius TaxID=2879846 RepID=A0ABY4M729_9ACTN|nr:hypothetical protein [Streptomyces halobius]UQA93488.1 hypothetical protein K9S39_17990 [Streptomyces halobius]
MISGHRTVTATTALGCGAALLAGAAWTGLAAASGPDDGEGDLANNSAQQVSDTSRRELLAAKSLRLRTETSVSPTKLDLTLDRAGNCTGAISKGESGRVELIKRGKQVWMRPDAAFWKTQLPGDEGTFAAKKYRGRFLHGTTDDAYLQHLSAVCDLTAFQKSAAGPDRPPSPPPGSPTPRAPALHKGKPTVHEGIRVLPVIKKAGQATQTLYVAIKGKHYPVKLTTTIDRESSTLMLSNFEKPVPSKTPPRDKTVDISVLEDRLQGT